MVALILLSGDGEGPRGGERGTGPGLDTPPEPPRNPPARPLAAVEAAGPEGFLADCAARPREAVPQLLALLMEGNDVAYEPRWTFRDGRLVGFPSLRAIYLVALARIQGADATDALSRVLETTESPEESCLIAFELSRRDAAGWAATVIARCDREPDPARLPLLLAMAGLAAGSDPGAVAQAVFERAPRGEDGRDPRVLASALRTLPLDRAAGALGPLLEGADVTRRAKSRYVKEMLSRGEVETLVRVREIVERGRLDEATRNEICQEAANSVAFLEETATFQQARARGDRGAAEESRARFLRRLDEMHRLAGVALGVDLATSDDLRAASVRRLLDGYRAGFAGG